MNTTTQYSTPSPSAGLTPKERLLLKLEEAGTLIDKASAFFPPPYLCEGITELVEVCKYLAEENETLKADIQALQNARKGAGWS